MSHNIYLNYSLSVVTIQETLQYRYNNCTVYRGSFLLLINKVEAPLVHVAAFQSRGCAQEKVRKITPATSMINSNLAQPQYYNDLNTTVPRLWQEDPVNSHRSWIPAVSARESESKEGSQLAYEELRFEYQGHWRYEARYVRDKCFSF